MLPGEASSSGLPVHFQPHTPPRAAGNEKGPSPPHFGQNAAPCSSLSYKAGGHVVQAVLGEGKVPGCTQLALMLAGLHVSSSLGA